MSKTRFLFFLMMLLFVGITSFYINGDEVVNIQYIGQHGDHFNFPIPADQPDVYYYDDDQEIIIDGTGYVTYYDIEITSTSDWTVYVSTQVNGSYDTIDVSSLPQGEYVITIDSPTGNSFEGFFETY